ncbi:hypothetical protein SY89_02551 [Halolamina pelagica]|uniref:Uncharacterized protein n=1 Tax=Halolamina pelagica TaxID=699431 RepID=A0A0P7I4A2_9EURY|nr:hypothetical protein [Halolamina pelagica]KPN31798.1 hypothetical protein SY89_02551 [Halolamina pelagica]
MTATTSAIVSQWAAIARRGPSSPKPTATAAPTTPVSVVSEPASPVSTKKPSAVPPTATLVGYRPRSASSHEPSSGAGSTARAHTSACTSRNTESPLSSATRSRITTPKSISARWLAGIEK